MNRLLIAVLLRIILLTFTIGLGSEAALGQYRSIYRQQLTGTGAISEQIRQYFKSDGRFGWKALQQETGLNGTIHERWQQTFLGFPVENAIVVVHQEANRVFLTGHYAEMKDASGTWQVSGTSDLIQQSAAAQEINGAPYSENTVWIQQESGFVQALKVEYFSQTDFAEKTVFILPETSEIIEQRHHKCHLNQTGTAVTQYHGSCQINTQLHQNLFRLRKTIGSTEISTLDLNHQLNYTSVTEITDNDNFWEQNNHPYATDAHFCAEKYFDFLQNNFQRISIDNAGYPLKSFVNYGQNLANAFWNGNAVVYGSGNTSMGALTVIDIAGHEFTHGLIQKTAGLVYSNESGILNEAISDIFGEALDQFTFPANPGWTIAEKTGQPLRSFSQPSLYGQPAEFNGPGWYYGTGDNGGVHINSGFINHWFYLLSEGGSGVNGKGWSYHLSGIGMNRAIRIVYESLIGYLVPQSGFEDFYQASLLATVDLYGYCSPEYMAVCEAWKAVGFKNHASVPPSISSTGDSICQGGTVMLSAEGLPGSEFSWIRNGQVMNETGLSVSAGIQGSYQVSENRCGNIFVSTPFVLTVHSIPVVTAIDASGCPGEALNLTGLPSGGMFSVPTPYSGPPVSYHYTYTDGNGCTATASALVYRHQVHLPTISASSYSVPVNDDPLVLVSDSGTHYSGPGVSGNLFYPEPAGIGGPYLIEVSYTDHNGCVLSNHTEITVLPPCRNIGEIPVIEVEDVLVAEGNLIRLKAMNAGQFDLIWKISGDVISNPDINQTEVFVSTAAEMLEVELWYINTCSDSAFIRKIIYPQMKSGWFLYPNPVKDQLMVKGKGLRYIGMTDISGKRIQTGQVTIIQDQIFINTDNLDAGVYFITVLENGKETRKRFLKMK